MSSTIGTDGTAYERVWDTNDHGKVAGDTDRLPCGLDFANVNPFGGLLLRHPISVDKVSRSKALQPNYKSWLEGSYRCKASIPGQGSLVSRTANIRLSGKKFKLSYTSVFSTFFVYVSVGR
ncbi:unnamed protein product [Trichobilharzia regenti]|nr:unnamed protein product [Trichobilharzia regenti]